MANFPFYKQETDWTCGPAAMRMALEFCGIKKSEKQLIKLLGTNKTRGTRNKSFPAIAKKYKLNCVTKKDATLEDLEHYQKERNVIIICYYYPKEKVDHYSVLKEIDSENIYFYDPWFGKNHKYSLKYFDKIWKSDPKHENVRHWFFAIRKDKKNTLY